MQLHSGLVTSRLKLILHGRVVEAIVIDNLFAMRHGPPYAAKSPHKQLMVKVSPTQPSPIHVT